MSSVRAPAPYGNPFDVSGPYAGLMRLALGLAILPGLGMGLVVILVYGLGLEVSGSWPQLAQGHGQVQALGFTVLFIVAVGLQLFPRFLGAPLQGASRAVMGGTVLAVAVTLRLIAQPLEPGVVRSGLLLLCAIAVPLSAVYAASVFHGMRQRSVQPSGGSTSWIRFVAVGGTALGGALLLHTWVLLRLAAGDVMAPSNLDEALIYLELAGFVTCLVLGVASRVFGRFLLLRTRPALEGAVPRLALAYGAGLLLVALGWLVESAWVRLAGSLLNLGALLAWLWLVGLYDRPSRASGTPYVTDPTRRWVRGSFAFLMLGLAIGVWVAGREALLGEPAAGTELSALRHAIGQGFMLPLMVGMAARLLPIYSADVLKRKWLIELTVDLLLVGALLRVGAELLGGYSGLAGPIASLGGTVSVLGFCLFAATMWSSLARLPKPRPAELPVIS